MSLGAKDGIHEVVNPYTDWRVVSIAPNILNK